MAFGFSYPGVYVQEVSSGVHTIAGVGTSATAFVDVFDRGPLGTAVMVTSWAAFERTFGGLAATSEASYGLQQFFLAGGAVAWVVRVATAEAQAASVSLDRDGAAGGKHVFTARAANPGKWGANLQVAVWKPATAPADQFNLNIREVKTTAGVTSVVASESYLNVSAKPGTPTYAPDVVNAASALVRLDAGEDSGSPKAAQPDARGVLPAEAWIALTGGADSNPPTGDQLIGTETAGTGLWALDRIAPAVFNLVCLPAAARLGDSGKPPEATKPSAAYQTAIAKAAAFARDRRAFLLVDPPAEVATVAQLLTWFPAADQLATPNAAIYFPRLMVADPLNGGRLRNTAPSGTMAGVYARTDATRGVWKAPAGVDTTLTGASLAANLTDAEQGALNPMGVNVLRTFPIYGSITWGARTLYGADQRASEWKYVPVRRTALFIEESLMQGLRWVVFEPNDEPLWTQIRLNVDSFMNGLYRRGAFQGATAEQAYMVACDATTTTQGDIDSGIVNVLVGFAPLKPAEFVLLRIQQLAGQTA